MIENKDEPSLEKIDDYDGKESCEKKRNVRLVIAFLVLFGFVLYFMQDSNVKSDVSPSTQSEVKK